ncbi:MAG: hypothetical protein AB8G05_15655 [Oligoflexales bacterium]
MNAKQSIYKNQSKNLEEVKIATKKEVGAVANDPMGRYRLREAFYEHFGFGHLDRFGFGRSELDFLKWEINRGALNPLASKIDGRQTPKPGSPWWRDVNTEFNYLSELAGNIYVAGIEAPGLEKEVQFWLDYIHTPNERTWYRAHNSSIVKAYLNQISKAKQEDTNEQYFLNQVLYRLCYAQALAMGDALGDLGEILADPRLPSVNILVHLPVLYPDNYQLTPQDVKNIHGKSHGLQTDLLILLDNEIILPNIEKIYMEISKEIQEPQLNELLQNGKPIYPNI